MTREALKDKADTVTIRIDFSLRRRGGKKLIIVADGEPIWAPPRARIDNTLVKALARAFRWRKLLETGVYTTLAELAAAEKINPSYLSRILRLTLLAPEIIESILDGQHPTETSLCVLMRPFAVEWREQVEALL
jgi:hypothetical protein